MVEVGSDVTTLQVGDKVTSFAFGGFGQYNVAKATMCNRINPEIAYENAMGEPIKCIATVLSGATPQAGETGVIVGCGAMGQWCIQSLKDYGLSRIIAVDIDDRKLEIATRHGATHIINSAKENAAKQVAEITDGKLADFVIEGTGVPEVLDTCADYLKNRGRLVLMSSYERPAKSFDFYKIFIKGIHLIGASPNLSENEEEDLKRGAELINNGTIHNDWLISHRFPLEDINRAFKMLENKPKEYIKGVVVCNEDMLY